MFKKCILRLLVCTQFRLLFTIHMFHAHATGQLIFKVISKETIRNMFFLFLKVNENKEIVKHFTILVFIYVCPMPM